MAPTQKARPSRSTERMRLAVDRLVYFSHWITPVAAPKRYDTRFFAAIAPARQHPLHDAKELVDTVWVRTVDALQREREGKLSLRRPTLSTLETFHAARDSGALMASLRALKNIRPILPAVTADGGRVLPGEAGYAEAARDPAAKWR